MTFEELVAPYLTLENAEAYAQETDQIMWVETNILDPLNIPRRTAATEYVELALDALVAA